MLSTVTVTVKHKKKGKSDPITSLVRPRGWVEL